MRPGKLYALQVVRALAAILVIWVHVNDITDTLDLSVFTRSLGDLRKFGACGVDLFFVLSGFVVSLSASKPQDSGTFLGRRFLRIYPLLWIVLVLYVAVNPGIFSHTFSMSRVEVAGRLGYSALLLPSPSPSQVMGSPWVPNSWTLVHEVFFYLCLFVGMRSRRWDPRAFSVAAVGSFVALNTILFVTSRKAVPFIAYYGSPIALEFVFGVALGWILPLLKGRWWPQVLLGLGVFAFAASAIHPVADLTIRVSFVSAAIRTIVWGIPAALVVGGLSLLDWKPQSTFGKAAVYAGDACYSIYLFQWLPLDVAAHTLPGLASVVGGDLASLIAVIFTTLAGIIFYTLVERPLMHRLNARFFPKRPRVADAGLAPAEL